MSISAPLMVGMIMMNSIIFQPTSITLRWDRNTNDTPDTITDIEVCTNLIQHNWYQYGQTTNTFMVVNATNKQAFFRAISHY